MGGSRFGQGWLGGRAGCGIVSGTAGIAVAVGVLHDYSAIKYLQLQAVKQSTNEFQEGRCWICTGMNPTPGRLSGALQEIRPTPNAPARRQGTWRFNALSWLIVRPW